MKRRKTLAGAIMSMIGTTVYSAIYGFLALLAIDIVVSLDGELGFGGFVKVFLPLIASIIAIVLNACLIPLWNKDAEAFGKKKGLIIATICLNIILLGLYIFSVASLENPSIVVIIAYIALSIIMLLSAIFYIVDLIKNKKEEKKDVSIAE